MDAARSTGLTSPRRQPHDRLVYRARVRNSDRMVALKKIRMDDPRPEPQRDGVSEVGLSALLFPLTHSFEPIIT